MSQEKDLRKQKKVDANVSIDTSTLAQEVTLADIKTQIDKLTFTGDDLNVNAGISSFYLNTPFVTQTSVNVIHNFGEYPVVQVIDNTGAVIIPLSITNNTLNDFTITFSVATSGNIIATLGAPRSDLDLSKLTTFIEQYNQTDLLNQIIEQLTEQTKLLKKIYQ